MNPNGETTTVSFQFGTGTSYGSQTTGQSAGAGTAAVNVSAQLTGLSPGTTYHYRLVASSAGGPATGTDASFTTAQSAQQIAAQRAVATYQAMQQYMYAPNVNTGDGSALYVGSCPAGSGGDSYSYLWPFTRAFVGTITLAGIPSSLVGGTSYAADVNARVTGLAHYWDGTGYASCPRSPYSSGGPRYYDDQAWVGLALDADYQLTGTPSALAQAEAVFNYVYPAGWGNQAKVDPGGIWWVSQTANSNHDRTTTSNAPNAELGFRLEGQDPANRSTYDTGAQAMYGWVNTYLYNVSGDPNYDSSRPALVFDKVQGSAPIDKTLWTYNQGAMIAASVAAFRATGAAGDLSEAEAIATTALGTFTEQDYLTEPAAFDAIFFRDLLQLYGATGNTALQAKIVQTIQTCADDVWNNYRAANGLFNFPTANGSGTLLSQGAMLQIYSMLAWDPSRYAALP